MIRLEEVVRNGHEGFGNWLSDAEEIYNARRKDKVGKWDLYGLLDFRKQLTMQKPGIKYKVLYNTSGAYLNSCVVDLTKPLMIRVDGSSMRLQAFVVDTTAYYYDTDSDEEAFYMAAVLNSTIVDDRIKPMQARGSFGPRHIHKKPWELPIQIYDPKDAGHQKLADLGRTCSSMSEKILPRLVSERKIDATGITPNAVGRLRAATREELQLQIAEIDKLVTKMLDS